MRQAERNPTGYKGCFSHESCCQMSLSTAFRSADNEGIACVNTQGYIYPFQELKGMGGNNNNQIQIYNGIHRRDLKKFSVKLKWLCISLHGFVIPYLLTTVHWYLGL